MKETRMRGLLALVTFATVVCLLLPASARAVDLQVYGGLAVRQPLTEIAKLYEQRTGVKVSVVIGPPRELVTRMAESKVGDVFVPGSYWAIDLARSKGIVAKTEGETVGYLVPCIAVEKGNPQSVRSLKDLARPGLRVAIRSDTEGPEKPCLGDITTSALKSAGIAEKVKPNIVASIDKCDQVAAALRDKKADAVICWTFFAARFPDDMEAVSLPEAAAKARPIPAAVTTCAADPAVARAFVRFLRSPAAQRVFVKCGYRGIPPKAEQARPGE
jgi:molybdate transport system substrate-binding protein